MSTTGEQLSPYALTTLQRVKDLLFDPQLTISVTGNTTSGSATVSSTVMQNSKVIRVGQTITGPGIPNGTTVLSTTTNTLTLSQNATATASAVILSVIDQPVAYDNVLMRMINYATNYINNECGRISFVQQTYVHDTYSIGTPRQTFLSLRNTPVFSVSSFQWRAGTPTNPNWTDFIPDQWELVDPQTDPPSGIVWYPSGTIRVYGVLPRIYNNMIRVTYVAGYPVNWANAEDRNTHWLPGDITSVCENIVVRRFKRRTLAGQSSQALEGATHSWRNDLDAEDKAVLGQYRLLNF
jgi:hypothetical protein